MEITPAIFVIAKDRVLRYLAQKFSGCSRELLEDAFMTALSILVIKGLLRNIQTDSSLVAMLCVISRNWLFRELSRSNNRIQLSGITLYADTDVLRNFEDDDFLNALINTLPSRSKEILETIIKTDSVEQTALIMNAKPGSVQRLVNRAINTFRKKITK